MLFLPAVVWCLLVLFLGLARRVGYRRVLTISFGNLDRRLISLHLGKVLKVSARKGTLFIKLWFVLAVFFSNNAKAPKTPTNHLLSHISELSKDSHFHTLEALVCCNKLAAIQLEIHQCLFALSKTKIKHFSSHKYFAIMQILLSGDVCLNPGPVRHPCSTCFKPVAKNHRALLCDSCNLWAHIKCENICAKTYAQFMARDGEFAFMCNPCLQNKLPFPEGFDENPDIEVPVVDIPPDDLDDEALVKSKGLKLAHLNINSLLPKISYVRILLSKTKLDVLVVSETKIDDTISDNELKIDGYEIYRQDRNRHGGGVLFFVSDLLESHPLKHLCNKNTEALWVKICLKKSKPLFIAGVYRPPSRGSQLESTENICTYLTNSIRKLPDQGEFFILGDFNTDMLTKNALSSKINELCSSLSSTQLIEEPTRVTENSSTLIDLILANSSCVSKAGVFHLGISDHSLIYVIRKFQRPKSEPKYIKVRSFKNFEEGLFLAELRNSDWSYFLNFDDLDEACTKFNETVNRVAKKHAPFVSLRIKGRAEAWVTPEFLLAIKERDFWKKKSVKSKSITDWAVFKEKRNQVNNMKCRLKQEFYNESLSRDKTNPKKLWKSLKNLVPDDKTSTTTVKRVVHDGTEETHPKKIANVFNKFFVTVGSSLASKFTSDTTSINPPVNISEFAFAPISQTNVEKLVMELKNDKATGPDGVGSRLLKAGSPVLSHILSIIFSKSLEKGYVPRCWKTKRVSPIFKTGSKIDPSNYRPISILPIPMKVFEKIIHKQVADFIFQHNFLNDRQSGFRKMYSTTSAVLDVSDFILKQLDENNFVGAVLIDFKKAFDTVDHSILLKKLWCLGFRDVSFEWFESYLSDRYQKTLINNTESDLLQEDVYGVPQGSVLGPLLFLIYINDLHSVIKNSFCHLYADDTIIVSSAKSVDTLISTLEDDLARVDQWLQNNKMTINMTKTEFISFGTKRRLDKFDNKTVNYMGTPLERKRSVKYLGVIFDEKMQWENHIKNIKAKISFKFSKIKAIASCLTKDTKNLLINALVMPYFNYCSPAWANAAQCRMSKLDRKLQEIRRFLGKESDFSIKELVNKNDSILIFKAMSQLAPGYICSKLNFISENHEHKTRGATKNHVTVPTVRTNFGKRTLSYRAAEVWNPLPYHVTTERSLLKFKTSLSDHLGRF